MSNTYPLDFFTSPITDFFNYFVTKSFFKNVFEGHIVVDEFIGPIVLSEYFSLSFDKEHECEILTPTTAFIKTNAYERKIISKVLIVFLTFCNRSFSEISLFADNTHARILFSQNVYLYPAEPNLYVDMKRLLGQIEFKINYFEPITPKGLEVLDTLIDQVAKMQLVPIDLFVGGKLIYSDKPKRFDI